MNPFHRRMEMPRTDMSDLSAFSPFALISCIFSASLSSFSSLFVMTFILRSQSKLRGAYHRIMFFMSFWDLVWSLAIAATTLPMPSDVRTVYPAVPGKPLGNVSTCEAQAFIIFLGSGFTICSNVTLNLFYICTIRFGMAEEKFNRIVLPTSLVLAVAFSLPIPIILLSLDLFNPDISFPYRGISFYPYDCVVEDDVECIRGKDGASLTKGVQIYLFSVLIAAFVLILGSLILVVSTVWRTEMAVKNAIQEQNADADADGAANRDTNMHTHTHTPAPAAREEFIETREVMRQALMYVAAFLLTWAVMIIYLVADEFSSESDFLIWPALTMIGCILEPLQGFFNAAIFVYSKVRVLQRADRRLRFRQALDRVVASPDLVPEMLMSRLEIVERGGGTRTNETDHLHHRGETYSINQGDQIIIIGNNSRMHQFGSNAVEATGNDGNAPHGEGEEEEVSDLSSISNSNQTSFGVSYAVLSIISGVRSVSLGLSSALSWGDERSIGGGDDDDGTSGGLAVTRRTDAGRGKDTSSNPLDSSWHDDDPSPSGYSRTSIN